MLTTKITHLVARNNSNESSFVIIFSKITNCKLKRRRGLLKFLNFKKKIAHRYESFYEIYNKNLYSSFNMPIF